MTADTTQSALKLVESDEFDRVHASKNVELAAFEQLVKRYDRKLFRIAQSAAHNREDRKMRFKKPS
jgi:hypothetical protein